MEAFELNPNRRCPIKPLTDNSVLSLQILTDTMQSLISSAGFSSINVACYAFLGCQ